MLTLPKRDGISFTILIGNPHNTAFGSTMEAAEAANHGKTGW